MVDPPTSCHVDGIGFELEFVENIIHLAFSLKFLTNDF